jgi:cytochrome c peroxidase
MGIIYKFLILLSLPVILFSNELITPIPLDIEYNKEKAALGKKLFFDTRLSKDNTISCASCHILTSGGDDNLQFSVGIGGQLGNINAPTVFNSVFNIAQFWDGRAKDLQEQAHGPIENPIEMGEKFQSVITKLQKDTKLQNHFNKIYKEGITAHTITDAIAHFETALITPNAPFDKYLQGEQNAISKEAQEGFKLFAEYVCISCHNGVNIGGNLFQKIGLVKEFKTSVKSLGKFDLTGDKADINYFKVPTLRNISQTSPYFHDGSVADLPSAVKVMFSVQLGIIPPEQDVEKIVKFLKTLDGEIPKIAKENP